MAAVTRHLRPEPGVTEIRVHGVGGTTPEALLEQTGVQQATGDTTAGFFRGAVGYPGRSIEAYSWGGLTARSRNRAFWVLLLPFSLINLAGWMVEPAQGRSVPGGAAGGHDHSAAMPSIGTRFHEVLVQFVGLCATAMYVMWAALLTMNMLAFQCGAIAECRQDRWYLDPFEFDFFTGHPGRRVVVALAVPVGLLAVFWLLGRQTASRYDDYNPDEDSAISQDNEGAGSVLGLTGFWYPGRWRAQLVLAHIATVLLLLGGLLGRATREFETHFAVDVVPDIGYLIFWICLVAGLVLLANVAWATWQRAPLPSEHPVVRTVFWVVLAIAVAALAVAAWLTWRLDIADSQLIGPADGAGGDQLARPTTDLWGFGWAPIMLLATGALFIALFSAVQLWRWFVSRTMFLDQLAVVVMLAFIVLWQWATWVALAALLAASLAQWLPRPAGTVANTMPWWRFAVFAGVCVAGALTRRATVEAASPFGVDWPRLTPVLLFTAILVALSLAQTSSRTMNNRVGPKPLVARVALLGIPGGLILLGWLAAEVLGRDEWVYGAAWLGWMLAAITWLAQFSFAGFDRWRWNGPATIAALALAILMGTFSALATWLADLLDGDGSQFVLRATAIYDWLTLAFAGMLVAIAAGFLAWYALVKVGIGPDGTRKGRRTLVEADRAGDVVVTMGALLLGAALLAFVIYLRDKYGGAFQSWIDDSPPSSWNGIVQAASWLALGTAFGAFMAVRRGMRDPAFRTRFGVLWDVATFWPRWFHALAPPAYTARAVPELQARVTEIVKGSSGAAILSGHSQGSVVAVASIASMRPEVLERIRLVTHGSPLARFYQRFFPAYFTPELFDDCARRLGGTGEIADGTWLNYWRPTDPIGDPVFGAGERGRPSDRPPAQVLAALLLSESGDSTLPDVRLADPHPRGSSPYEPTPTSRGHSGYMADPAMWQAIDALAAELRSGAQSVGGRPNAENRE